MYEVKLMFITNLGCEWLEEVVKVNEQNYKDVINDYFKSNNTKAQSLVDKWRRNGEDEDLYLNVENISAPMVLYREIDNLVMGL